mmetsp:Transcript_23616/g.71362  ORF Transcript_23616/g.71362 Transcript_23616/m.71362 type:complete len:577 (-) Transcript_23616:26-1756(-)
MQMFVASREALIPQAIIMVCMCGVPHLSMAATGSQFRGSQGEAAAQRTVAAEEVESSLQGSLEAVLSGGDGATAQRLAGIEKSIWPTFQALPKNSMGRLAPRSVRYAVHNYFAKEHGWLIKGLEPHGMQLNMTEVHGVSILQDKAPALVEALLEAKRAQHGLSLEDIVAMTAALERLIFDESIALLEASYALNGLSVTEDVDETSLHEVLTSYLLVFEMGIRANLSDAHRHRMIKAKMAKAGGSWPILVEFEQDAVANFGFANRDMVNPFVPTRFPFTAASKIVEDLAGAYGKWQNTECRQMKEELMALDPDGSGLVPLHAFYSQPETADYQFTESVEYLRQIGALDEAGRNPRVRIANYVAGPSNCIASSSYYSVCCLSDCEHLMNELEGEVRAPSATPERLVSMVSNLTSTSDEPRQLSHSLKEKLRVAAERNGGEVPLHGRLFAQWMHFAFPSECPYPHIVEDTVVLTPTHWLDGKRAVAPEEERQKHVEKQDAVDATEPAALLWTDDEVLLLQEPERQSRSVVNGVVRMAVQIVLVSVLGRTVFNALSTGASASGARMCSGKQDGFPLPLRL